MNAKPDGKGDYHMKDLQKVWEAKIKKKLVGRKIVDVRYMNDDEQEEFSWMTKGIIIFLDDGSNLMPQSDDEGNDAGAISTSWEDLPIIPVIR